MQWTHHALDTYMAQELSQLTACDAEDIAGEFEKAASWVASFILSSIFVARYKEEAKPIVFAVLRRSQMSILEYGYGRTALIDYLSGDKNRLSVYFKALHHFEIVIALLYQAHDFAMRIIGGKLFESGDGSDFERLNRLYNASKHLETSTLQKGHLHPVWITNKGLVCSSARLSWAELVELIRGLGMLCEMWAYPKPPENDESEEST